MFFSWQTYTNIEPSTLHSLHMPYLLTACQNKTLSTSAKIYARTKHIIHVELQYLKCNEQPTVCMWTIRNAAQRLQLILTSLRTMVSENTEASRRICGLHSCRTASLAVQVTSVQHIHKPDTHVVVRLVLSLFQVYFTLILILIACGRLTWPAGYPPVVAGTFNICIGTYYPMMDYQQIVTNEPRTIVQFTARCHAPLSPGSMQPFPANACCDGMQACINQPGYCTRG